MAGTEKEKKEEKAEKDLPFDMTSDRSWASKLLPPALASS